MSTSAISAHVSHLLRHVWDPIVLDTWGPDDEYKGYVPGVVALVRSTTANEAAISEHLRWIEEDRMALPSMPGPALRAARALLGLREACGRAPDHLVTQTISSDGVHCLWVFERPDGLCFHEHAALRHEVDENGAWSWWTKAGSGRSGLFATATEAEQDARSTIDWLGVGGHERCP